MRLCRKGYRQACRALIGGIDNYAGSGTILYFYDRKVVEALQGQFPLYADNFPVWASQSKEEIDMRVLSIC